jgi:hypothetical protein
MEIMYKRKLKVPGFIEFGLGGEEKALNLIKMKIN